MAGPNTLSSATRTSNSRAAADLPLHQKARRGARLLPAVEQPHRLGNRLGVPQVEHQRAAPAFLRPRTAAPLDHHREADPGGDRAASAASIASPPGTGWMR